MKRLSKEEYFLNVACVVARRSTCLRRQVGAVLVDKNNHILSTGYNGMPSGFKNCCDNENGLDSCLRKDESSGSGLEKCLVVHAEQNALLQCPDINKIATIYVTTFPCVHCLKLLMNTACYRIIYYEKYLGSSELIRFWESLGQRDVYQVSL